MLGTCRVISQVFSRYSLSPQPLRQQHDQDYCCSKPSDDDARLSLRIGSDTLCYRGLPADAFRTCAVEAVVWQRLMVTVVPIQANQITVIPRLSIAVPRPTSTRR